MARPLLSLCMIAKNEAHNLPRCLGSVSDAVDEVIVVDTGSRDQTVAIAEQHGATVLYHQWTNDFAAARNAGLAAATGEWILVLDADEQLEAGSGPRLRALLRQEPEAAGVLVPVINLVSDGVWQHAEASVSLRVFRNHPEIRYERELHEQVLPSIERALPGAKIVSAADVRILHHGYQREEVQRKGKQFRNLPLARQAVKEIGDDFSHFNLGIELLIHKRFSQALAELEEAERLLNPNSGLLPKLAKAKVYCLMSLGERERALREVDAYLEKLPEYTDLVFLRGHILFGLGRHAEAGEAFRRCLELGPASTVRYPGADVGAGSYEAAWMLGQVHEHAEEWTAAAQSYLDAFQRNRQWLTPLMRYAAVLLRSEPIPGVTAKLEEAVGRQTPGWPLIVAQCLFTAKLYDEMLQLLERPEAAASDPGALSFLRGQALFRLGRWDEAITALEQVPAASPNADEARRTLLWLYITVGQRDAERRLRRKLKADEDLYIDLGDHSLTLAFESCLRALALGEADMTLLTLRHALKAELGRKQR